MGRGEGEKFWSGKKDKGLGRKPEINIFHRPTFTAPPTVKIVFQNSIYYIVLFLTALIFFILLEH